MLVGQRQLRLWHRRSSVGLGLAARGMLNNAFCLEGRLNFLHGRLTNFFSVTQHCSQTVTILIVEDYALLGRVLESALTRDGQTALHVTDGNDALPLLKKHSPRLVLLDTALRDGQASQLLDEISTHSPAVPVILLTAHRSDYSRFHGRAHRIVTKSIDLPELRRIVQAALCEERGRTPLDDGEGVSNRDSATVANRRATSAP